MGHMTTVRASYGRMSDKRIEQIFSSDIFSSKDKKYVLTEALCTSGLRSWVRAFDNNFQVMMGNYTTGRLSKNDLTNAYQSYLSFHRSSGVAGSSAHRQYYSSN